MLIYSIFVQFHNYFTLLNTISNPLDYGSEKLHFVLNKQGFSVSQRQIQKILDIKGLTDPDKNGRRGISEFEKELISLGILFWTSRRNHPQTNGKIKKWFDTMKRRFKKYPDESLQDFIKWYNEKRIHPALNYDTPEKAYWEKP